MKSLWVIFYLKGTSQFYYNIVRTLLFYVIGALIRLGEDRIPGVPVLYAVLSHAAWAGCAEEIRGAMPLIFFFSGRIDREKRGFPTSCISVPHLVRRSRNTFST